MNRRQKKNRNHRLSRSQAILRVEDHTRYVRMGRDGKGRYCLYYTEISFAPDVMAPPLTVRKVIAGGLTKLAAMKLMNLMKEY